jgi:hypothetical protein
MKTNLSAVPVFILLRLALWIWLNVLQILSADELQILSADELLMGCDKTFFLQPLLNPEFQSHNLPTIQSGPW